MNNEVWKNVTALVKWKITGNMLKFLYNSLQDKIFQVKYWPITVSLKIERCLGSLLKFLSYLKSDNINYISNNNA